MNQQPIEDGPIESLRAFTGRYRTAATRARLAVICLGITGFIAFVAMIHHLSGYGLISEAEQGVLTVAEGNDFDGASVAIALFTVLAYIPTGIAYLAWFSRTVDNIPSLGGGIPSVTPRWSIGWWFVPILSLVRPYQIARELHDRMATETKVGGVGLLRAWWITFVGADVLAVIVIAQPRAHTLVDLGNRFGLRAVSDAAFGVAAILAIMVLRRIQTRAEERAARATPDPGAEAFAPA